MNKQDRQGARTVQDLERKYNLGQGGSQIGTQYNQLSQTVSQYVDDTNRQITEIKDSISGLPGLEASVSALQNQVTEAEQSITSVSDIVDALDKTVAELDIRVTLVESAAPAQNPILCVTVVTDSLTGSALTSDYSFAEIDEAISAGNTVYVKLLAEGEDSAIYLNLTSHTAGSSAVFYSSYKNKPVVLEITA